jgi:hypothetical protein
MTPLSSKNVAHESTNKDSVDSFFFYAGLLNLKNGMSALQNFGRIVCPRAHSPDENTSMPECSALKSTDHMTFSDSSRSIGFPASDVT